jgi:hypothetical protein
MSNSQSLSLYHLGKEYQSLLSQLYDPETGEVNEQIDAELTALSPTIDNKCIAVASWIESMRSEKASIEFMKQQILKREAAYDKEINKALTYLDNNMKKFGIKEIKCPYFTIKIKTNPYSTDIEDESQIPERFMRTRVIEKTEIKPDKNAIKEEVLKTGVQIPGALVQQKTKLEILTDKI